MWQTHAVKMYVFFLLLLLLMLFTDIYCFKFNQLIEFQWIHTYPTANLNQQLISMQQQIYQMDHFHQKKCGARKYAQVYVYFTIKLNIFMEFIWKQRSISHLWFYNAYKINMNRVCVGGVPNAHLFFKLNLESSVHSMLVSFQYIHIFYEMNTKDFMNYCSLSIGIFTKFKWFSHF